MAFDPYQTLGVLRTASQDEIKSAYRKLAKKLHPDLNPGNKTVESQFKEVNKAYEFIGTPDKRARFDRGEFEEPAPRSSSGAGASAGGRAGSGPYYYYETQGPGARYSSRFAGFDANIFEDLFRSPPQNEQYAMTIDFTTSILGGEREITLPTGRKLKVKIPPGISSGTTLRLGSKDGGQTDIYIQVQVAPSPIFKRHGDDLEVELPISLAEAVLGGEARVPIVDGHVLVKIPKGISTGARLRIRGKGVPRGDKSRGDQYAVIKIVMPSHIDNELEDAMKRWDQAHPYNPRSET